MNNGNGSYTWMPNMETAPDETKAGMKSVTEEKTNTESLSPISHAIPAVTGAMNAANMGNDDQGNGKSGTKKNGEKKKNPSGGLLATRCLVSKLSVCTNFS